MNCRVIRDREAPGSNPGPPTKIEIKNRRSAGSVWSRGHMEVTDLPATFGKGSLGVGADVRIWTRVASIRPRRVPQFVVIAGTVRAGVRVLPRPPTTNASVIHAEAIAAFRRRYFSTM